MVEQENPNFYEASVSSLNNNHNQTNNIIELQHTNHIQINTHEMISSMSFDTLKTPTTPTTPASPTNDTNMDDVVRFLKFFKACHFDFKILNYNASKCDIIMYYLLRLFTLIIVYWVFIVNINYAIGQIYQVIIPEFFCEPAFLDQKTVLEYNKQQNSEKGRGGCYKINELSVNGTKLENSDIFQAERITKFGNLLGLTMFAILGIYFFVIAVKDSYWFCHDLYYHLIGKINPKIIRYYKRTQVRIKNMERNFKDTNYCCIIKFYMKYIQCIRKYAYSDGIFIIATYIVGYV